MATPLLRMATYGIAGLLTKSLVSLCVPFNRVEPGGGIAPRLGCAYRGHGGFPKSGRRKDYLWRKLTSGSRWGTTIVCVLIIPSQTSCCYCQLAGGRIKG